MALYDLSPEQRQQVEAFLMQPPPAQFASASLPQGGATPNIPPETLLKAQMGLLGSQGRVIQQMAFQNERRQLEARAADVARQIQSVNPLDPERDVKISRLASAYPEEFASSVVQQSLGLNEAQRRQALGAEQEMQRQMEEQMKRQQEAQAASLYAGLQGASPEQIETFIQQNPEVAFRNRSVIDPALERQAVARTELDYLPAYKSAELQGQTPAKIRAEATKFTNSLPKPLRTLAQPDREEAVRLAQELKAARAAEATAQEGTEPNPDAPLPSDAIATRLTGLLGVEELDNGTVEALTESRAKVLGASDYLPPSARARLYEKLPK